jgi:MYXO-CTERM domain-containing protein
MVTRKLGILLLALSFGGAATLPVTAQNTGDNRSGVENRRTDDGGFDLGWLGLIGLVGLIGLRRRDDVHRTVDRAAR